MVKLWRQIMSFIRRKLTFQHMRLKPIVDVPTGVISQPPIDTLAGQPIGLLLALTYAS
jgi:hypothetical protein